MAIYIDNQNRIKDIFINVNGQKKKITSMWANKSGVPTKVFQSNKGFKIVSWADGTDEEIAAMLDAHYKNEINISDYWSVGDERVMHLSAMDVDWEVGVNKKGEKQPALDTTVVILDFEHDDLVTPINNHNKTAISVQMKSALNYSGIIDGDIDDKFYSIYYEHELSSVRFSWKECKRKVNWINNIFNNSLPVAMKNIVKPVNKKCYQVTHRYTSSGLSHAYSQFDTEDYCFLLSCIEVGLGNDILVSNVAIDGYYYKNEGTIYEYYKNENNRTPLYNF